MSAILDRVRRSPRRPRRVTLRTRLTIVYGGIFLVAGIVLLGTTYALFNQQLGGPGELTGIRMTEKLPPPDQADAGDPDGGPSARREFRVITDDGDTLYGADAQEWIKRERADLQDSAATSLLTQGAMALLVIGAIAAGLGWLVAGRVLAPLHRVTDTAARIAAAPAADRGLHERIALTGPDDEVKDLADTFDTMVERLDRSFGGQRRFVANASHELRTPLTVSRALIDVAMHRKDASEDMRTLGADLLRINSRHERLISGLLLLAASENEIPQPRPVDLADLVAHVIAQTAHEATEAGVVVRDEAGEAMTAGDALLLERMAENLIVNGIRHNTGAGGWVCVTSGPAGDDRVELQVSNTGPAVAAYEIPDLFEPFQRRNADRLATGNGTGLGLSIVRSVVHSHGGEVAARPRAGGGLVVTVTLPADGSAADPAEVAATPRL